ncbi:uncharacterized protein TRAVEDRAFT_23001 [Trametes versicolor FP-101664 SS1]|uniref:uncharacterized protein n=1 Tax=Trametes versicolor (strain FP-101664) TaxID=717944 RepID=UPI0004623EA8|nr:uncharacterized protein TRAVEDRAFT_23001 [Trametes versicolor FP-101664 SS1]EIW55267.1 hypothetical protein TRAVEDRAFT_23001 [Trametes versicolor FP-101664 SS1]
MAAPPYPPSDPTPFKDVLSVFATALDKVDTHMTARLNRMEIAMGNMAKVATEALQVATSARQETKDGLERLHTGVVNAAKCSLASSEKIEMILGDVSGDPDADPEHERATVLGRIRQLERAVVELSESVRPL